MSVRKNRSNPIPGLALRLRKASSEPGFKNSWIPSYFVENEPAFLRKKMRSFIQLFFGTVGLIFILWLVSGSVWVGRAFLQLPLKKVFVKGDNLLNEVDVVNSSGLRPGQLFYKIKPYLIAERLQKHPAIKKADIRLRFPDEIHLFITEYQPVAILNTSQNTAFINSDASSGKNLVLIGDDQRLLKKLSIDALLDSPYKRLPLISGLSLNSFLLGTRLNSPVLERGLRFLTIFKKMALNRPEIKSQIFFEEQLRLAEWNSKKIHIDISDPLNLKINWPRNISEVNTHYTNTFRSFPLTVQMGSRNFGRRLSTFRNIYPMLDKKHPGLKSIDMRYNNRVMLVP